MRFSLQAVLPVRDFAVAAPTVRRTVQRGGVCRNFARLGVTFCRALNIPTRRVVG